MKAISNAQKILLIQTKRRYVENWNSFPGNSTKKHFTFWFDCVLGIFGYIFHSFIIII